MRTLSFDGTELSRIVCGTSYFGTQIDEGLAMELMDIYYARGGRTIDTARVYGISGNDGSRIGISESIVGRWLNTRRADVTVVTKCGHPEPGNMHASRLDAASLREDVLRSADALGRLPDVTLLHRDDPAECTERILERLSVLAEKGCIRRIGCSNWRAERIRAAAEASEREGFLPFVLSQIQWSLAETTPEKLRDDTLVCMDAAEKAYYRESGMPLMAFSSQAKGFFAKAAAGGVESLPEKARERFATPENLLRLERVKALAAARQTTPAAVSLSYIASNPVACAAIVGCSKQEQMQSSMDAAGLALSEEECAYLDGSVK